MHLGPGLYFQSLIGYPSSGNAGTPGLGLALCRVGCTCGFAELEEMLVLIPLIGQLYGFCPMHTPRGLRLHTIEALDLLGPL